MFFVEMTREDIRATLSMLDAQPPVKGFLRLLNQVRGLLLDVAKAEDAADRRVGINGFWSSLRLRIKGKPDPISICP